MLKSSACILVSKKIEKRVASVVPGLFD
jgi:hypothetical protein